MSGKITNADHPGPYIKSNVIPKGMNVTQAAKAIGVGRPALSNLLNGNASLSSEMAIKLEKAFGVSARELLAMQTVFDAGMSASRTNVTAVRSFVPPFASLKANDIEQWANNVDSRAKLAALLRMLVHSTCDGLQKVDFPAHDDSQRPGWDGEVGTLAGNPWIPTGASGWEFGTNKNIKEKADGDFSKSVNAISRADRLKMTFVFVTPRRWSGKDAWKTAQLDKKQWKDVVVLDSSDLEQWMEHSIPAQVWFANENGKDFRGTKSLERCWVKWNADCDPAFTPHIFDEASIIAGKKLLAHLRGGDRTLRIASDSVLEGLAFVCAMLSGDDPELSEIRDHVVVFSEAGPLTQLANKSSRFIPIVTNRETEVELAETGTRLGGVSIVPRTMVQSEADIVLDTLSGEAFRKGLEMMGLGGDAIERLQDESGRSLTVLRRRLARDQAIKSPAWSADKSLARSVFPFTLAGAWKNDNEVDRIVLCHLMGEDRYPEVEREFGDLLPIESSPVWSIGSFRGIVSKIDALYAVHKWVTSEDLERFYQAADFVLSEPDPSLDLPESERWAASIQGKTRDISSALREGIADSLVILATHGNGLFRSKLGVDTQSQATLLVRKLFANMDGKTMESQSDAFQRYAEAAPEEFLGIIERDLARNDPSTQVLMRPVGDPLFSSNPRVGLLWALDLLAWSPEYLPRVVDVLAKLCELEPEDRSGNSAMQSLLSIFRSWMPQTSANVEQRIAALDQLVKHFPEVGWAVVRDQYDLRSRTGHYGVKPKWRDYAFGSGEVVTNGERRKFEEHCLEVALSWTPMTREKLADLVDSLEGYGDDDRARVWDRVVGWAKAATDEDRAWLREQIRVGVSRSARRLSKKGAPKTATKAKVNKARDIYDELEPSDIVWKHAWLFKNSWVENSWEDIHDDEHDFEARDVRIAKQRKAGVEAVLGQEGVSGAVRLALSGNASHIVGNILAQSMSSEADQLAFIRRIAGDPEFLISTKLQFLLDGFFFSLGDKNAVGFINGLRGELTDDQLVHLFCLCRFGQTVWNAVEASSEAVSEGYWKTVSAPWARQTEDELRYAVAKLIEARRGLTALQFVHLDLKSIESEQLYEILKSLPRSDEAERGASSMDRHSIEEVFKILNSRGTISRERMASLEFLYLGVFRFDRGRIPNLEAEVNDNPSLFCEAIRMAYRGKNEPRDVEPTAEQKTAARNANTFIDALSSVPGVDEHGVIQAEKLKEWIIEARHISEPTGHRAILDYQIGEILAHAPLGEDGSWPCETVREAVNDLYSLEIERGITIGRYNARGATWRGEGGAQERELADQYEGWAKACEFEHPRMARILREMVRKYIAEAEWQDNEAMIRRRMRY
jgi:addiction module HigA family antidote